MKLTTLLSIALLSLGMACSDVSETDSDTDRLQDLKMRIDKMIEDTSCTGDAECKFMAIGHKPCGGPASYIIYSSNSVDEGALEVVVNEYSELQRKINEDTGAISDCSVENPPSIGCRSGSCMEVPG